MPARCRVGSVHFLVKNKSFETLLGMSSSKADERELPMTLDPPIVKSVIVIETRRRWSLFI